MDESVFDNLTLYNYSFNQLPTANQICFFPIYVKFKNCLHFLCESTTTRFLFNSQWQIICPDGQSFQSLTKNEWHT